MIEHSLSQQFNSRVRQSILKADWFRVVENLTAEELQQFPDNPLFRLNGVAGEFGCELSSVRWEDLLELRFVRHYGYNKELWTITVNRDVCTNPAQLEEMLRAMLPGQVAAANDRNTIREYFGPAASR